MVDHSRARLVTAAVLAVVFGSGMILGYALDSDDPVETAAASEPDNAEVQERTPLYEQVGGLSQDQMDSIAVIREGYRTEWRAGWRKYRDRREELDDAWDKEFRGYVEAARDLILGVMTPEQAIRYDSLLADWDRRQAERRAQEEAQNQGREPEPQP